MTVEAVDPTVALRAQLSAMQGLLVMSMLMTESDDVDRIVALASTSGPSLGTSRTHGVYLLVDGWVGTGEGVAGAAAQADLASQTAVLTPAGGAVTVPGEAWGWAFPLRSPGGHHGFLFIGADEKPSDAEQFLLRVLAQQTGIALAGAQLHARDRARLEQLRKANRTMADTLAALERSNAVHSQLTQLTVQGAGVDGIAATVHELTGLPVAVEDRRGRLRSWAGPGRPEPYPLEGPEQREQMIEDALEHEHAIRSGERLIAVAGTREEVLGILALHDPQGTADVHATMALEHGATVLAMELFRLESLAETERRLGRDLVSELLAGTVAEHAVDRAEALGHDLAQPHRVLVVEPPQAAPEGDVLSQTLLRLVRDAGVGRLIASRGGGRLVVLAPAVSPWERLVERLRHERGLEHSRVGVGQVCAVPADYPASLRQAELALRLPGGEDGNILFESLGVYQLFADVRDVTSVERFARQWLGSLIEYDADKGSDLVLTLTRYLELGGSYAATAEAVAVHRSTLKYRLQRIREISGHNLTDPNTRFSLDLATRAWSTLLALGASGS